MRACDVCNKKEHAYKTMGEDGKTIDLCVNHHQVLSGILNQSVAVIRGVVGSDSVARMLERAARENPALVEKQTATKED